MINLLAAAEALKLLQGEEKLRVTHVAGTSAGAIVAALFATGCDLVKPIREVQRYNRLLQGAVPKVPRSPMASLLRIGGRALWRKGWSLTDLELLRRFLIEELPPNVTMGEVKDMIGCGLTLVCADITNGVMKARSNGEDLVLDAVLDSCAMPFVFRGPDRADSGPLLVDGGTVENLFVEDLLNAQNDRGPVFGISFKEPREQLKTHTPVGMLSALTSTMVKHGVKRAKRYLPGRVLELESGLTTLDFGIALSQADAEFNKSKSQAEKFFRDAVWQLELEELRVKRSLTEAERKTARDLFSVYDQHVRRHPLRFRSIELLVIARSAAKSDPSFWEQHHDEVIHVMTVEQEDGEPLFWYGMVLQDWGSLLRVQRWEVRDAQRKRIGTKGFRILDPDDDFGYLAFFEEPIKRPDAPLTVSYRHSSIGALKRTWEGDGEPMGASTRKSTEVTPEIKIVIAVPKGTEDLFTWAEHPADTSGIPGDRMTSADLSTYDFAPTGFELIGWMGKDVPPGTIFAKLLMRRNRT